MLTSDLPLTSPTYTRLYLHTHSPFHRPTATPFMSTFASSNSVRGAASKSFGAPTHLPSTCVSRR